jgi:hypothetical protein
LGGRSGSRHATPRTQSIGIPRRSRAVPESVLSEPSLRRDHTIRDSEIENRDKGHKARLGLAAEGDLPLGEGSFRQTGRNLDIRLGSCEGITDP